MWPAPKSRVWIRAPWTLALMPPEDHSRSICGAVKGKEERETLLPENTLGRGRAGDLEVDGVFGACVSSPSAVAHTCPDIVEGPAGWLSRNPKHTLSLKSWCSPEHGVWGDSDMSDGVVSHTQHTGRSKTGWEF